MARINDGDIIGFEEGLAWLPSHVLEEALFDYSKTDKVQQPIKKHQHHFYCHHHRHRGGLCRTLPPAENLPPNLRSSSKNHPKQRYQNNWQSNGAGMQAFFLASGRKTSGTGVFLPSTGAYQLNKKSACSPVLLPSRVVHALNLNVHSLGVQVSPRPDRENNCKKKSKIEGSSTRQCGAVNSNNSSEIFLPKEWTY